MVTKEADIKELAEQAANEGLSYFLVHYASPDYYVPTDSLAEEFINRWIKILPDLEWMTEKVDRYGS